MTDVPLRLTATGPGSRASIIEYVQTVIEQRTTVNDDTTAETLARGIVTSILHRLGAGYTVATGGEPEDIPDGATTWLYLVVDTEGGYRRYTTDRERAHEAARDTSCVVAMLPIVGDYRQAVDDPAGASGRKEGER